MYVMGDILKFRKNKWLPKEINDRMKFLDKVAFRKIKESEGFDNCIKLVFKNDSLKEPIILEWDEPVPIDTLEEFNNNMTALMRIIEEWIRRYSTVNIELFRGGESDW
jgi:hypothetical protein